MTEVPTRGGEPVVNDVTRHVNLKRDTNSRTNITTSEKGTYEAHSYNNMNSPSSSREPLTADGAAEKARRTSTPATP